VQADVPGADVQPLLLRLILRFGLANLAGALLVFVYLTLLLPDPEGASPESRDRLVSSVTFAGFMVVVLPIGFVVSQRQLSGVLGWLSEGRAPTALEREGTLRLPLRFVVRALLFWSLAPVVFGLLNLFVLDNPAAVLVQNTVGTVLGALTTCALTFLVVEYTLRPVFAMALAGEPPARERYLGIRPRLMLSWALGSGIPFLGIALVLTVEDIGTLAPPIAFLAVVGLGAGGFIMFVGARSVADPLRLLRGAVQRVEEGDFSVRVPVDDGGEVGMLQAGLNRMVAGLGERQRLRDLFGRHVGVQVARQALERTGLGGEQRQASALFVDLIGSTALAHRRPVHEVVGTLNALFDAVVKTVGTEGGWVNKFEGDGALCVFGAPMDQPDHAARALRAARRLRDCLLELQKHHPSLDAGIGVSSGTVVAGNVGAEQRYEYTVIGSPVNEASRLTEVAKERPCRVLAAAAAVEAAGEEAGRWAPAGTFALRGGPVPVEAYEPLTAVQARPTAASSTS
jgi:adenylate cyclase